jgi:deoxyguanosine kinase
MFIAVEGCVGSGKSTVAKGLASRRGSKLLLEDFESNPFLRAFYVDPVRNATETEFAFLLLHYHQLKAQVVNASNSEVIADFHLGKDLLYAELNLRDSPTKSVFRELYECLAKSTPSVTLMVYLSASSDLLVERIRARKRDYELDIDPGYYGAVNAAYDLYFSQYPGKKVRIPMDEWDFVGDPELYSRLMSIVDQELNTK